MNITETIVKMVQQVVPVIENEIKEVESRLVETRTAYNRSIAELIDVEGKVSEVKSWLTREVTEVEIAKSQLQSDRKSLYEEIKAAKVEVKGMTDAVAILKTEETQIESRIAELTREQESLGDIEVIKSNLLKEIERLNNEATEKSKFVSGLEVKLTQLTQSLMKAESDYLVVNKDLIESIDKQTKESREYANQLNERAKVLDVKEEDLKTVEARWKKLYESKGAGFKI